MAMCGNSGRPADTSRSPFPHHQKELYETSGHWSKFANDLFRIKLERTTSLRWSQWTVRITHRSTIIFRAATATCPNASAAETTMVYRDEQTGELNGLSRVRCITQWWCSFRSRRSSSQEMYAIWDIIETFLRAMWFPPNCRCVVIVWSRSPKRTTWERKNSGRWLSNNYASWFKNVVQNSSKQRWSSILRSQSWFYDQRFIGPSVAGGHDPSRPEYARAIWLVLHQWSGEKERIVMVHAAIMGSIERFVSILIEHHAGGFPFWLAPVQVKILPITDQQSIMLT